MNGLLEEVSRSFYLTVRVLPGCVRPQIGLAYLLARASDTIVDTEALPVERRLDALESLRGRILGKSWLSLDLTPLIEVRTKLASLSEQTLLKRIEEALQILSTFAPADRERIRRVLSTIMSGQELDLRRFAGANESHIVALQSAAELDDYTYRVAGCVGEFWTELCRAHLFPEASVDENWLRGHGVRFGKGLQLVNILRDLPADLRLGRCYVPVDALASYGLTPADLLESANEPRFRELYHGHLNWAEAHLKAGWEYTNALPFRQVRLRLACAWPVLIGAATLKELASGNVLDATSRIKVSRANVKRLILQSVIRYPWRRRWRELFSVARS